MRKPQGCLVRVKVFIYCCSPICIAMPVESLVNIEDLLDHPIKAGAIAIIFFSIAVFITLILNYSSAGLLLVTFTVIPSVPLFLNVFEYEEKKIEEDKGLIVYQRAVIALLYFFLGVILASAIWYFILPSSINTRIFSDQLTEIKAISASMTMTQWALNQSINYFEVIFFHNLSVLILILLFSLIYGAGSMFILSWNASVIGVFVGQTIGKVNAASKGIAETYGSLSILHSIGLGLVTALGSIAPHGIFELLAYVFIAVAGSIISVSITKKTYRKHYFVFVVSAFVKLVSLAVVCLGIGAYIETKLITG